MSNKRLLKELQKLILQQNSKPLVDNDYIISFDENNVNKISTIIKGPYDSVYRHKFIKLDFDIPHNYPHSPPKVTFIFYDKFNFKRIHPNFYEDGRCCSTILNTWNSGGNDKWTSSMGIETILLTFQSFLDNKPYTYEPGDGDDTSYTQYVLYQTWHTCLIKYLDNRESQPEIFTNYIYNYLLLNIEDICEDLHECINKYPSDIYFSPRFEIFNYVVNFNLILNKIIDWYQYIDYTENKVFKDINNTLDYNCNICFDTQQNQSIINLSCNKSHSFHIKCLEKHIKNNGNICSLCREEICNEDLEILKDGCNDKTDQTDKNKTGKTDIWIINPITKRKVKTGSRTHQLLLNEKII